MPAASPNLIAPPPGGVDEALEVELLLTALPAPANQVAWPPVSPPAESPAGAGSGLAPLFKQVPQDLQRRRSDNWLAWNVGRVRPDTFGVLFERYWQPISAFCLSIVGSRDEAEDAAAETMSRAYATLSRREQRPEFRPWIHAIARNAALDRIRERSRGPQLAFDGEELDVAAYDEPADVLGRRERLARLMTDLQALSERQRAAIVMRELSGLTYEEIGEALETSPERAKGLVADARASLTERRAGRAIDCGEYRRAMAGARGRAARGHRLGAHRDSCPSCRAYARPRLLSGVFFLPILELFSRAGRRIADVAGPGATGAGPAGAAKVAAAASVLALAVPATQHAGDEPRPARERDDGRAAQTAVATPESDAGTAKPSDRDRAGRSSRRRGRAAEGRERRAQERERSEAPARDASPLPARSPAGKDAPAQPDPGEDRVSRGLEDIERLATEDLPGLVEQTTEQLNQQLQDTTGQLPGVEIRPDGVQVDVPELLGGGTPGS